MQFLALLAQTQPAAPGSGSGGMLSSLVPLVLMFVIFYFLLIRPQQKKQKAHDAMVAAAKIGDKIISSGGIHGVITNVKDRSVTVRIADNVKIELERIAIMTVEKGEE